MIDENLRKMYSENNAILFESLTSEMEVFWKCEKGHDFIKKVRYMVEGHTDCPYCTNRKLLPGFNDLYTRCINEGKFDLINEFDLDNNPGLTPQNTLIVDKKICWVKNVEKDGKIISLNWVASIYNRFYLNQGCPYLTGQKVHPEFNSLQANFPQIAKEWDYEKNDITPDKVSAGAGKFYWWKIEVEKNGKIFELSWEDSVTHRTAAGRNCPYLSGKKVLEGFNDLAHEHPELMPVWDFTKNDKLGIYPNKITSGSHQKVHWKCPTCGYEYMYRIDAKVLYKHNCAICSASNGEKEIKRLLDEWGLSYEFQYKFENCQDKTYLPFDFAMIDGKNICIEYDGEQHFKPIYWGGITKEEAEENLKSNKKHDRIKTRFCKNENIALLRINYLDYSKIEEILKDFLIKQGIKIGA
jgi:uncharacterized protein (DUF983 family)